MGLLVAALVVTLFLSMPIGSGFAETSYTATTVCTDNSVGANYGVLSITCGGAQHPLESALKSSFTTVSNTDTEITRQGAASWTMPNSVTVTFTYINMDLSDSISNVTVGVRIADLAEVSGQPANNVRIDGKTYNGYVSLSVNLTKAQMEAIGVTEARCELPCVTTIYNNADTARTLSTNATVGVSVNSGTFKSTMPLSGITTVPASGSSSTSGTVTWFCASSSVTYDNHNVCYTHYGSDTGTVSLTFEISNVTGLDGATFKVFLDNVNRGSGVMSGGTATIAVNGLSLTNDIYEKTLKIMVNHSSAVTIGVYNVTITATFNSYHALNHGEVSTTVDTAQEVIDAIIDANGGSGAGGTIDIGGKQAAVTESQNDYGDGTVAVDISYTGSNSSSTGHGLSNRGSVDLNNLGTNLGDSKFIIVLTLYKYGTTATVKATSGNITKSFTANGTSQVVICSSNASGTGFTIYTYSGDSSDLPTDSNSRYWMSINSISIEVDVPNGSGRPTQGTSYVDMDLVVQTA